MLPRTLYESITTKTMATLSFRLMMIPVQTNKVLAKSSRKMLFTKPGRDDKTYFRYFSFRKTFLSGNDMFC